MTDSSMHDAITYQLSPSDPAGHRCTVVLTVPHPDPAGQTLSLPAWIPGSYMIRDFARNIETIDARAGGRRVPLDKLDKHTWKAAPCRGPLVITCVIYAWDLSVRAAHLDDTHGFFNGTSVFLRVHGQERQPCLLDLQPPRDALQLPWRVYTSLPEAKGHAQAAPRHGFGMYRAPDYDALLDHPIEMGTPQVATFTAHGATHELVFTGSMPNLDLERLSDDVQRICDAQIAFFEPRTRQAPFLDSANRYVFMTMVTGDGYGGLEHRASTALMTARGDLPVRGVPGQTDGYRNFLGLVSHEYFHTWNVKRIKPAVFAPYDLDKENPTRLLWLFEGFTSYYDDLFLVRTQVIGMSDYLRTLGKTITSVLGSPGRLKQSVADSSFDAWTKYYRQDENSVNAIVSYYTKGSLVALALDLTIRSETRNRRSLDDLMRLLWDRYGRDFYQGAGLGVPEDAIGELVKEATGVDITDFLARYVDGREDPPLEALLARQGITVQWKAASTLPSIGARTGKQGDDLRLSAVIEKGPAHKAGLSAHDVIVAIDGVRVTATNLDKVLGRYRAGDTVVVHAFRRDELRSVRLKLAAPPATDCVLTAAV